MYKLIRIGEASYPAKGRRKTVRHLRRPIGRELLFSSELAGPICGDGNARYLVLLSRSVSVLNAGNSISGV